ncbi:type II toxin-antitoxin system VapC family toxin [Pelagibius sp.]|uniref:type II toxin-antitoxin system VapC family toxin n=1 Tax=Pelagibius sp. TaxID=1931238 RepID=UPI002619CA1E|nr:type II toxin-antitoxin system VapC family toxin [Pelagibius sp.]
MFLLDTMVLSELRKKSRNTGLVSWMTGRTSGEMYVSVVSVGEIQRGIDLQRDKDSVFSVSLAQWLDRVLVTYRDQILPIDLPTARRWGRLSAALGHDGADLMIAATALERGLKVVTRNVRHFETTGVQIENPFH